MKKGITMPILAILIMNALVWFIDRHTAMRRFGTGKGVVVK